MSGNTKKKRGIMLITSMFITVFIVMFATAAIIITISQQRNTTSFYQTEVASKAAEAGISYAMMRLQNTSGWRGCEVSNPAYHIDSTSSGVEVYEHIVDSSTGSGCVEGKITMGNATGYFDMYFTKPTSDSSMHFFKNDGLAGPMPSKIVLCNNNTETTDAIYAKDSTGTTLTKKVPGQSVLIVCRGRVGKITRTVETCFRFSPSQEFDGVVTGRGNIFISCFGKNYCPSGSNIKDSITGGNDVDCIALHTGANSKPSIMRAKGNIYMFSWDGNAAALAPGGTNFLYIDDANSANGGRMEGTSVYFPGTPDDGDGKFITEGGQDDKIPDLKLSKVASASKMSSISNTLEGGTYVISPLPKALLYQYPSISSEAGAEKKYPQVFYIKNDDKSVAINRSLVETSGVDMTEEFAKNINGTNSASKITMGWDHNTRTLSLKDSYKVTPPSDSPSVKSIVFKTYYDSKDRISLKIGVDDNAVFFGNTNDGGSIYIDGQLSGTGTIACKGNLEMQAESQLNASPNTGVSIYSEGTVKINKIPENPYVEDSSIPNYSEYCIKQSISAKINWAKDQGHGIHQGASHGGETIHFINSDIFTDEEWNQMLALGIKHIPFDKYDCSRGATPLGNCDLTANLQTATSTRGRAILVYEGSNITEWQAINTSAQDIMDDTSPGIFATNYDTTLVTQYTTSPPSLVDNTKNDDLGRPINRKDTIFKGLVFACKNFVIDQQDNRFKLEGGLVAYGGNPEDGSHDTTGNITINAKDASFKYDSKYMSMLKYLGNVNVETLYWSMYKANY